VASDVLALADALSPSAPVDLVGHSFGGRAALYARRLAPSRIGRVVLLDIAPGPIPPDVDGLSRVLSLVIGAPEAVASRDAMRRYFVERGVSAPLAEWVILNLAPRADGQLGWRIDREALAQLDASSRREDLWDAVDAHTACIRGGASQFVSNADVARLQAAGCAVTTLEGAGHFVHVDALMPVVEALVGALGFPSAAPLC
jgi:esterase